LFYDLLLNGGETEIRDNRCGGVISAELWLEKRTTPAPRVVHAEGPRRYNALEVAATLSKVSGRKITARELPQSEWILTLTRAGLSESYAELVFELYVAHNAGRIDVEPGGEVCRGATEFRGDLRRVRLKPL
jgi:NAD(P)H dehydrogenase (quinone)